MAPDKRYQLCFVRSKSDPETIIELLPNNRKNKKRIISGRRSPIVDMLKYKDRTSNGDSVERKQVNRHCRRHEGSTERPSKTYPVRDGRHYVSEDSTQNPPISCWQPLTYASYHSGDHSLRPYQNKVRNADPQEQQNVYQLDTLYQGQNTWPQHKPSAYADSALRSKRNLVSRYDKMLDVERRLGSNQLPTDSSAQSPQLSFKKAISRPSDNLRTKKTKRGGISGRSETFREYRPGHKHRHRLVNDVDELSSSLEYLDIESSDDSDWPIPERTRTPYHHHKQCYCSSRTYESRSQHVEERAKHESPNLMSGALPDMNHRSGLGTEALHSSAAIGSNSLMHTAPQRHHHNEASTVLPPLFLSEAYTALETSARTALSSLKPLLKSFQIETKVLNGYTGIEILDEVWREKVRGIGRLYRDHHGPGDHDHGVIERRSDLAKGNRIQEEFNNGQDSDVDGGNDAVNEYQYDNNDDRDQAQNQDQYQTHNDNGDGYNKYSDNTSSSHNVKSNSSSPSPSSTQKTARKLQQDLQLLYSSCQDTLACRVNSAPSHLISPHTYLSDDSSNLSQANITTTEDEHDLQSRYNRHQRRVLDTISLHNQITPFLARISGKLEPTNTTHPGPYTDPRHTTRKKVAVAREMNLRPTSTSTSTSTTSTSPTTTTQMIGEVILTQPDEARRLIWELEGLLFLLGRRR